MISPIYTILTDRISDVINDDGEDILFEPSDDVLDEIWKFMETKPEDYGFLTAEAINGDDEYEMLLGQFAATGTIQSALKLRLFVLNRYREYARSNAGAFESDVVSYYMESQQEKYNDL